MLRLTRIVVVALSVLVPIAAHAQERMSQIGARTLAPDQRGMAGGSGYPSLLWMQYTAGAVSGIDAGVRADVYAAAPLGGIDPGIAAGVGVPFRFMIGSAGSASFALRLTPDFLVGDIVDDFCFRDGQTWHCGSGTGTAVGIEPALLVGLPAGRVQFVTGAATSLHVAKIHERDGLDVVVPFSVLGGIEVPIAGQLQALALMQPGVSMHSSSEGIESEGYLRFWAGLETPL